MRFRVVCFLLETWSLYMLVDAAEIPAIKRNATKTNSISVSSENYDHKTPPVQGKYQSKVYEKTLITTVPDCFDFEDETQEEYVERTMCEMHTIMYDFKASQEKVDPAWLYWNSQNPMGHEPVYCQNVASKQEKWNACYYLDLHFDEYDLAVQEIIKKYLQMSPAILYDVQVNDFFIEMENEYGLATIGIETEIMGMMLDNLYYYISRTENWSYPHSESESESDEKDQIDENDGAHSYYYYFYNDAQ